MSGRFLILGASGLLGRHLYRLIGAERAVATYHAHPVAGGIPFDAGKMRLRELLRGRQDISAAFVLYGVTKLDDCARDPAGSAIVNVESIRRAIDDLAGAGVKPIFASSDAVFDGTKGNVDEREPPRPSLAYGKQKLEVERHLQGLDSPWVIARLSKLVSSMPEQRNLLSDWVTHIERRETIRCATDLVFSPADVEDAAQAMLRFASEPITGVFNVCGPRALTRMELLETLVDEVRHYLDCEPAILPCRMRDLPFVEPRPLNVSMNPGKLYRALGTSFRDMREVCADLASARYRGAAVDKAVRQP